MDRRPSQSAVCRHLAVARGARGPPSLREAVLRARRDGEPDQGVPARPLCRSHLGQNNARQPAAAMVRLDGLCPDLRLARRIGLAHTQFARACCGTIRLKLLKIGALVRTSVRRIKLAMPSAFPYQAEYHAAHAALAGAR